ncbi:ATP-binding cassette domain-containing protein [Vibrio mimicus]
MKPLISLRDVHHSYSDQKVLTDVNFDLFAGESVVISGPSGEGKSTLVRVIAGLLRPSCGLVTINATRIGFVFQEPRLLPWRTALENVMLPLQTDREKGEDAARKLLQVMGLAGSERLYPDQLSGGMRQRVSLARALAVRPDALILDEPFTGLDKTLRNGMKALLETFIRGKKLGIVQVTHHNEDILKSTQHIYRLEKGRLHSAT